MEPPITPTNPVENTNNPPEPQQNVISPGAGSVPEIPNVPISENIVIPETYTHQTITTPTTIVDTPEKRPKIKHFIIAGLAGLLLLGGVAAAYVGYYVPNKPENVWKTAMTNTGKGYDKIAEYIDKYKTDRATTMSGSFNLSGDITASGTIEQKNDGSNSEFKANVSAATVKADIDAISYKSENKNPDFYIKINGLDSVSGLLGSLSPDISKQLKSINNQWYVVDHSLYEQFLGSAKQMDVSKADVTEMVNAASGPTKKYVFTDDSSKSVFVVKQTVGKEQQDGRNVYHYKVGINKANLKTYDVELCNSLAKTKLFKLLEGYHTETEALNDCKNTSDIDNIKDSDYKDVWVDMRTKLIHKVRFAEAGKPDNYFDILQDYQGGDVIPIGIVYSSKDSSTTYYGTVNAKINMSNDTIQLNANFKSTGSTKESVTFNLNYSPGSNVAKIQKPTNTKDINELLDSLGYGALASGAISSPSIQAKSNDVERKTDLNALAVQLEVFYTDKGYYPSLTNLNNSSWRASNLHGFDDNAMKDPVGTTAKLVSTPTAKVYAYKTIPSSCLNSSTMCEKYTLIATLSDGSKYTKESLN